MGDGSARPRASNATDTGLMPSASGSTSSIAAPSRTRGSAAAAARHAGASARSSVGTSASTPAGIEQLPALEGRHRQHAIWLTAEPQCRQRTGVGDVLDEVSARLRRWLHRRGRPRGVRACSPMSPATAPCACAGRRRRSCRWRGRHGRARRRHPERTRHAARVRRVAGWQRAARHVPSASSRRILRRRRPTRNAPWTCCSWAFPGRPARRRPCSGARRSAAQCVARLPRRRSSDARRGRRAGPIRRCRSPASGMRRAMPACTARSKSTSHRAPSPSGAAGSVFASSCGSGPTLRRSAIGPPSAANRRTPSR